MNSCPAFRVMELEQKDPSEKPALHFQCASKSIVWSVRLEGLVCILDCQSCPSAVMTFSLLLDVLVCFGGYP